MGGWGDNPTMMVLTGYLRWCCALLLAAGVLGSGLRAHPHISRSEAAARLVQAETLLESLAATHGGPPPAGHGDVERWRELRLLIAECHFLLGDVERALADCDRVIEQWPRWPDAYSLRRACRQALGDEQGADADAMRYLELGSGDPALAIEMARRPVPEDNPAEAAATRALQLRLVTQARARWPAEPGLLVEHLRLLAAVDMEAFQGMVVTSIQAGTDGVRVVALRALHDHLGEKKGRRLLEGLDHAWLAAPPKTGYSGERLAVGLGYDRLGMRQLAHQASVGALVTLALEEAEIDPRAPLGLFQLQGLRGDRARALALLDRWDEALRVVNGLLAEHHDPLYWMVARIWCLREMGDGTAAQAALDEYEAYFTDIGLTPPPELPSWP